MQGPAVLGVLMLVVVVPGCHGFLSRWTRQAIHCQAGDEACQKCSVSCSLLEVSRLPECCEAYNACCDQYFQACKKCSNLAAQDQYFPEYCCASFTDCCQLVTTFTTDVKPPEPVKSAKKSPLKVPAVAAPKPTVFPGGAPPQPQSSGLPLFLSPRAEGQGPSVPLFQSPGSSAFDAGAPIFSQAQTSPGILPGQASPASLPAQASPAFPKPQTPAASLPGQSGQSSPAFPPGQVSRAKSPRAFSQSRAEAAANSAPSAPAARQPPRQAASRSEAGGQRTRAANRTPSRPQPARRPHQANLGNRRGRVTSRGRVLS